MTGQFPDISAAVRQILAGKGYELPPPPPPAQSIPVRYWIDSERSVLGYLDVSLPAVDGDTVEYSMTFREADLCGEQPRHEIRFEQKATL